MESDRNMDASCIRSLESASTTEPNQNNIHKEKLCDKSTAHSDFQPSKNGSILKPECSTQVTYHKKVSNKPLGGPKCDSVIHSKKLFSYIRRFPKHLIKHIVGSSPPLGYMDNRNIIFKGALPKPIVWEERPQFKKSLSYTERWVNMTLKYMKKTQRKLLSSARDGVKQKHGCVLNPQSLESASTTKLLEIEPNPNIIHKEKLCTKSNACSDCLLSENGSISKLDSSIQVIYQKVLDKPLVNKTLSKTNNQAKLLKIDGLGSHLSKEKLKDSNNEQPIGNSTSSSSSKSLSIIHPYRMCTDVFERVDNISECCNLILSKNISSSIPRSYIPSYKNIVGSSASFGLLNDGNTIFKESSQKKELFSLKHSNDASISSPCKKQDLTEERGAQVLSANSEGSISASCLSPMIPKHIHRNKFPLKRDDTHNINFLKEQFINSDTIFSKNDPASKRMNTHTDKIDYLSELKCPLVRLGRESARVNESINIFKVNHGLIPSKIIGPPIKHKRLETNNVLLSSYHHSIFSKSPVSHEIGSFCSSIMKYQNRLIIPSTKESFTLEKNTILKNFNRNDKNNSSLTLTGEKKSKEMSSDQNSSYTLRDKSETKPAKTTEKKFSSLSVESHKSIKCDILTTASHGKEIMSGSTEQMISLDKTANLTKKDDKMAENGEKNVNSFKKIFYGPSLQSEIFLNENCHTLENDSSLHSSSKKHIRSLSNGNNSSKRTQLAACSKSNEMPETNTWETKSVLNSNIFHCDVKKRDCSPEHIKERISKRKHVIPFECRSFTHQYDIDEKSLKRNHSKIRKLRNNSKDKDTDQRSKKSNVCSENKIVTKNTNQMSDSGLYLFNESEQFIDKGEKQPTKQRESTDEESEKNKCNIS